MNRVNLRTVAGCHFLARAVGILAVIIGLTVLVGWMFDIAIFKSIAPGWVTMKANSALAFLFAGIALWLLTKPSFGTTAPSRSNVLVSRGCAALVTLIGALTLVEYLFGVDLRIDGLLIQEGVGTAATTFPGRMSSVVAADFLLLGVALLLPGKSRISVGLGQTLVLLVAFSALISLAGYLYDPQALLNTSWFTSTAVHTALTLLALAVGVLCLRPKAGLMRLFAAGSAGGTVLRRLLLPVTLLPVLLNWLELRVEAIGVFPRQFVWIVDAALTVFLVGGLVWMVAWLVHRKDSERLAAEDELRKSEERYRQLVEMSPDAIVVKNRNRIEYVNGAGVRLLGVSRHDDIVGKSPLHFVHPDYRAKLDAKICAVLQEGKSLPPFEQMLVRADGSPVDVELSAAAVDFNGGRSTQVILRDITERKRAAQMLRESDERFRLIAETISEVFWMANVDINRTVYVSPAYEHVWGRTCESLYQNPRSFLDAIHMDDRERVLTFYAEKNPAEPFEHEYRIVRPDGSVRWIWDRGYPVPNEAGEVLHHVGVAKDITERKLAEESLRRDAHILAQLHDAVICTDLDGRVTYWNTAAVRLLGRTAEETLGKSFLDYHPANEHAERWHRFELVRQGQTLQGERQSTRKDGTRIWIRSIIAPYYDKMGKCIGVVSVAADITEYKRAEHSLRQTQADLSRVTRISVVNELAASIAHEVNQPLGAVVTNANAALRWLGREFPNLDEAREALRQIAQNGNRASDIITRIRTFLTKGQPGRSRFGLGEAAREILTMVEGEARSRNVSLETRLAPHLLPISADRIQFQQVLLNLLMNSLDALEDVEGRPRQIQILADAEASGFVRVAVRDTGVGIHSSQLEQVFTAFHTTKATGLGMGLSISRTIVEAHGGRMWAMTNDGPGVTFVFTLPVAGSDSQ